MTRSISSTMAPVLERLELDRPAVVTSAGLASLLAEFGITTPVRVVAARLRTSGWLLATGQRGVWEYAPADRAGAFSAHDPVLPFQAFLAVDGGQGCALTFQAAAWARGLADRVPARLEVAVPNGRTSRRLPGSLEPSVFRPALTPGRLRGVPVLQPDSVLVHMAAKPTDVRSWTSAEEWLTALAGEIGDGLVDELDGRAPTVSARAGYLLSGLRPDMAERIRQRFGVVGRAWFGPRGPAKRHNTLWKVTDTLLPFDPASLESVS